MTGRPASISAESGIHADEVQRVQEAIGRIDCQAQTVEKESDTLYEIDDATCGIGQYDIKLNENFEIISMTRDE